MGRCLRVQLPGDFVHGSPVATRQLQLLAAQDSLVPAVGRSDCNSVAPDHHTLPSVSRRQRIWPFHLVQRSGPHGGLHRFFVVIQQVSSPSGSSPFSECGGKSMLSAMNSRSGNCRSGFAGGNHLVNGTPVLGSTICCTGRQPRSRRSCSRCTPLIRVPISNGARSWRLSRCEYPAIGQSARSVAICNDSGDHPCRSVRAVSSWMSPTGRASTSLLSMAYDSQARACRVRRIGLAPRAPGRSTRCCGASAPVDSPGTPVHWELLLRVDCRGDATS